jgi:hypothetical protein
MWVVIVFFFAENEEEKSWGMECQIEEIAEYDKEYQECIEVWHD